MGPRHIALHSTASTLASALHTFTSPSSTRKVSAHFIVDGASQRIIQCVALTDRSHHALDANDFAIGVETVDGKPFGIHPEATYPLTAWLVRMLCEYMKQPINENTVGPHSRWVATACPANLDWRRIVREASVMGFDPRANVADDDYIKQTVRNVVLGEPHLTASAMRRALTGAGFQIERPKGTPKPYKSPTAPKRRTGTKAAARAGHGKGGIK